MAIFDFKPFANRLARQDAAFPRFKGLIPKEMIFIVLQSIVQPVYENE
jgi:hypothetical protein